MKILDLKLNGEEIEATILVTQKLSEFGTSMERDLRYRVMDEVKMRIVEKVIAEKAALVIDSIDISSLKNAVMIKTAGLIAGER